MQMKIVKQRQISMLLNTDIIFDHSRSGVAYNFGRVCLSVCL